MHVSDWYATFCHLAGVDPADSGPDKAPIDSVNMWPGLVSGGESPRRELIVGMAGGHRGAYRAGSMKLLVGPQMGPWVGSLYPNSSTPSTVWPPPMICRPACLYNLTADPQEEVDLFAKMAVGSYLLGRFRTLAVQLSKPDEDGDFPGGRRVPTDPEGCRVAEQSGWWQPWSNEASERDEQVIV